MAKRKRSAPPKRATQRRAAAVRPKKGPKKGRPKRPAPPRRPPARKPARSPKRPAPKTRRPARRAAVRRPAKSGPRRQLTKKLAARAKPRPQPTKPVAPKPVRLSPSVPAAGAAPRPKPARAPRAHGGKPVLDRDRRRLSDDERGHTQTGDDRLLASVRSGGDELKHLLERHTEASPALTAGDVDANWGDAYAIGDEAPGGDNPTPDQDRVDDIGKALGVNYDEGEELIGADKIEDRDRHRWELDPASSDDWPHDRD